jgi:hypothetical protein
MKRIISSLLVASMLATSVPAWADPTPPPTVDPAPVVSPLIKGQPAPYTGVLLSPEAVAQVIAEKDTAAAALALAVKHQADLDAAQLKYQVDQLTTTCTADKSILQAQVDDNKKQIIILNDQLKKTTGGPGAPVWIGLGAVGGVVVTVLTVFAIGKATK